MKSRKRLSQISAHDNVKYRSIVKPDFTELAESYPEFRKALTNLHKRQNKITFHKKPRHDNVSKEDEQNNHCGNKESFSTNVDFEFNLALTKALLHKHFDLTLPHVPKGKLIPPVPNRLNYVLWLKELMRQNLSGEYFENNCINPTSTGHEGILYRRGLDIGVGATAIYPLLLSSSDFTGEVEGIVKKYANNKDVKGSDDECNQWKFIGTDIDAESVDSAKAIVRSNGLEKAIDIFLVPLSRTQELDCQRSLKKNPPNSLTNCKLCGNNRSKDTYGGPIEKSIEILRERQNNEKTNAQNIGFDFCMTNPPFYGTHEEAMSPRSGDKRARSDMTLLEGVYPNGGEIGFVMDMIHDSFKYRDSCTWFTSMLGRKKSLEILKKQLMILGFKKGSIRTTEFVQGKSVRWGLAW
eukprot:CAMPEP_0184867044 /NCGR_PEP_ID=MMETSP0580-20130426/24828_1 /TAXON_ID=1118495 /ORGANISM="Dactyliosolen fragilissimus" /LENGTH=408 /DNA_ID=CAMNT_0027367043 /DNA_START=63 /DNA_END=1286 /DNA_ORIENTATION=+